MAKKERIRKSRGSTVSSANFSDAERELLKTYVAKYYVQGFSSYGIAKRISETTEFNVSYMSIGKYIEDVLDDWHASRIHDIDRMITGQLQKLLKVEQQAWDAWERSKAPSYKRVTKKKGTPKGEKKADGKVPINTTEFEEVEEMVEGVGDFRFLQMYKDAVVERMQWLMKGGFNRPDDPAIVANTVNYTQNVVYIGVVDRKRPDGDNNVKTIETEPI